MANKKHMRICSLCHETYEYCPVCGEDKDKEPWHIMWDSLNCKDIDAILSNWGAKIIDSATAYALLKGKDVSRLENWNESFKAAYEQVMKEGAPKEQPKHTMSLSEELKQNADSAKKIHPKTRAPKKAEPKEKED